MNYRALSVASRWLAEAGARSGVTGHYWGFKYRQGRITDIPCVVFVVPHKVDSALLPAEWRVPSDLEGVPTDVIEAEYSASAMTARRRPCEAGWSLGHVRVTAGTFGLPVRRGNDPRWLILSNNHVIANSNDATQGDAIVQPGTADGGRDPGDRFATLLEHVTINFPSGGGGKKRRGLARAWWAGVRALGNGGARLVGCPYRVHVSPSAVEQPQENLVDAAIALPIGQDVIDPVVFGQGPVAGVRDLQLGDSVVKVGRTTETTRGMVVGVAGSVQVSYGTGRTARFVDQVLIASPDGSDFSQGGDSGSAILTLDRHVGGLLFAGGGGQTIANKFSHVMALLGVRP